ncbi:phage major capsid protein [Sediminispirochaeta smaragdinae]|uniref:Phage major capsid protein, HK97 family n=1 Tax=Sediminispirochaeta smaragdinae (strain DSM 11293 / JCM 15392 / SEBR 4228) TaxID=573413 RepID=E1R3H8_SEDSS|nr:phage major capsid protein [Sediminispirochaeta smaragdinae]ADK81609.1 phage major capsid protein, HK97 family [Sediminispirochaeta smaragdinae DSM 11293]
MAQRFDKIVEMRKKRKTLWEETRKYREEKEAANEDGKLTSEELRSYNERLDGVEKLTGDIEAAERELAIEERMLEEDARKKDEGRQQEEEHDTYRSAFDSYLRNGLSGVSAEHRSILMEHHKEVEGRALSVGTDSTGGYTVPDEMASGIVDAMKQFNGPRQSRAEVITTTNGRDIQIPTGNDTENVGEILSENTAAGEKDLTFGSKNLYAYMFSSKIIRVSYQLLQDSGVDIEAYLRAKIAERIGRATSAYFTTGTGSEQPQGIVTGSVLGKTAAAAGALSYDEVIDLIHSIDPSYRLNAELMFNDGTLKAFKKLKDSQGRPLWLPGVALREPDTINGYKYIINQNMAGMEAGEKAVLFGDMSAFKIRDVTGGIILRLTERYAEYAQVGFIAFFRHGSLLVDAGTHPIKHLAMAAA